MPKNTKSKAKRREIQKEKVLLHKLISMEVNLSIRAIQKCLIDRRRSILRTHLSGRVLKTGLEKESDSTYHCSPIAPAMK